MASDSRLLPSSPPTSPPNNPSSSSSSSSSSSDSPPPAPNPETSHQFPSDPNQDLEFRFSSAHPPLYPMPYHPSTMYYSDGNPQYPGPPPPYHPALPIPYCPPPPPVYPVYKDPEANKCHICNFLCRLLIVFLIVCIVIPFVFYKLFTRLTGKPEPPLFTLTQATVDPFTFATSPAYYTSDFKLTFSIINPSKEYGLSFKPFNVEVIYADCSITDLTPNHEFDQAKSSEIIKKARVVAVDVSLPGILMQQMKQEIKNNGGVLEVFVKVESAITSSSGTNPLAAYADLTVYCGLKLEMFNGSLTTGNVLNTPTSCMVET